MVGIFERKTRKEEEDVNQKVHSEPVLQRVVHFRSAVRAGATSSVGHHGGRLRPNRNFRTDRKGNVFTFASFMLDFINYA